MYVDRVHADREHSDMGAGNKTWVICKKNKLLLATKSSPGLPCLSFLSALLQTLT